MDFHLAGFYKPVSLHIEIQLYTSAWVFCAILIFFFLKKNRNITQTKAFKMQTTVNAFLGSTQLAVQYVHTKSFVPY